MRRSAIYKYTNIKDIEKFKSILEHGVYACPTELLNDPFEWERMEEEGRGRYRIACLTFSRNSKLMWGHYADGHRGCMIHFVLPDDYDSSFTSSNLLRKVNYENKIGYDKITSNYERLYHKDKKWQYEKEIRAVFDREDHDSNQWEIMDDLVFYKIKVQSIFLGCETSKEDNYERLLKEIHEYNQNHSRKIKVGKFKIKESSKYAFEQDNEFSFEDELRRYKII